MEWNKETFGSFHFPGTSSDKMYWSVIRFTDNYFGIYDNNFFLCFILLFRFCGSERSNVSMFVPVSYYNIKKCFPKGHILKQLSPLCFVLVSQHVRIKPTCSWIETKSPSHCCIQQRGIYSLNILKYTLNSLLVFKTLNHRI